VFETTPKQFVALAPNFWSCQIWKAGIFMHHDLAILEQVSYNTTFLTSQLVFQIFYDILHTFSLQRHLEETQRSLMLTKLFSRNQILKAMTTTNLMKLKQAKSTPRTIRITTSLRTLLQLRLFYQPHKKLRFWSA
jgi:hypothetical protein